MSRSFNSWMPRMCLLIEKKGVCCLHYWTCVTHSAHVSLLEAVCWLLFLCYGNRDWIETLTYNLLFSYSFYCLCELEQWSWTSLRSFICKMGIKWVEYIPTVGLNELMKVKHLADSKTSVNVSCCYFYWFLLCLLVCYFGPKVIPFKF